MNALYNVIIFQDSRVLDKIYVENRYGMNQRGRPKEKKTNYMFPTVPSEGKTYLGIDLMRNNCMYKMLPGATL